MTFKNFNYNNSVFDSNVVNLFVSYMKKPKHMKELDKNEKQVTTK